MENLGQYIRTEAIEDILREFCCAADVAVSVFDCDGEIMARASSSKALVEDGAGIEAQIAVDGVVFGRVVIQESGPDALTEQAAKGFADLLADILARLAGKQKELRTRIEQLAALYQLTAEFTGRRELQSVMDLVTETVMLPSLHGLVGKGDSR